MPFQVGSFTSAGIDPQPGSEGGFLDEVSDFAIKAAKTAATVKGLFDRDGKPDGADVTAQVQFALPQLEGVNFTMVFLVGASLVGLFIVSRVLRG